MFYSIRWRLVVSYVLITLFTVIIVGVVAYTLVRQRIEQQEIAFLQSNAEAVSNQALPLVRPVSQRYELQLLVETAAVLGNIRVKVLDINRGVIVDSGPPSQVDQFIWILPPVEEFMVAYPHNHIETLIFTIPPNYKPEIQHALEESLLLFEHLPAETQYKFIQRVDHPWGNRVLFGDYPESIEIEGVTRSDRILTIPIGDEQDPAGYIEMRDGLNIGAEALETSAQAFIIAACGAVLLAGIAGFLTARRLTTPLGQLTNAATQMTNGDLSVRAPQYGKDEIGQLAVQFNQMAERLETSFDELSSERDTLRRFISDASHEIRTPITALKNFNELLLGKAGKDPVTREEFLSESNSQIERLEWITENLLSLSRLDAGLTPLKNETIDVMNLIESVVAPFQIQALSEKIVLKIISPVSDLRIWGDRKLIELALSNLIDNALKFTSAAGEVEIGADKIDEKIYIWVRDSGPGIPQKELPHIFERFYRGRNSNVEGSGLGLAMVKSIVTAHCGEVDVTSELGSGSEFRIIFPTDMNTNR
jgi:signal transduction histidine kinase